MLSRSADIARVNIQRLTYAQFIPYLRNIGWRGPDAALQEFIAGAFANAEQIGLAIDVGAEIGQRIGFECSVAGESMQWEPLLSHLVASGLATAQQRDALLKWPTLITPSDAPQDWPEHLVLESLGRPINELGRIRRYFSHVKLAWHPQRQMPAKAYLGINHRWNRPDRPKVTGRWHESIYPTRSFPMRGALDAREHAIAAAINFLLTNRMQGGWWRDFDRIDPGEEYVSAFVATALAETSNDEAHRAAHWTWQLLSHRQHPMDGWAWNAISPPDTDSTAWSIRLAQTLRVDACARVQHARRFLSAHRQPDSGIASYVAAAEKSKASAPNGWQRSHT
jgi:hypothetical protein